MALKLVSFASGSKGNCTLITSDNTAILCDAGVPAQRISDSLKTFGLTPAMLDGIVITHEHSDHIMALPQLTKTVKLYAHQKTAKEIFRRQGSLKNWQEVEYYENGFEVGDIKVLPFRIPHDAAYPMGYTFECGGARVSVATDMGIPLTGVVKNLERSEVVLLEANHDVEMLKNGSYPYPLKQRILGNEGHLSNDASARIAERLSGTGVHKLLLGHLSENNNRPELALSAVTEKLAECEHCEIEVSVALQNRMSGVYEVK